MRSTTAVLLSCAFCTALNLCSTYDVGVLGTKIAVDATAMQFKTLRKDEIVDGNHGFSWKIRRRSCIWQSPNGYRAPAGRLCLMQRQCLPQKVWQSSSEGYCSEKARFYSKACVKVSKPHCFVFGWTRNATGQLQAIASPPS